MHDRGVSTVEASFCLSGRVVVSVWAGLGLTRVVGVLCVVVRIGVLVAVAKIFGVVAVVETPAEAIGAWDSKRAGAGDGRQINDGGSMWATSKKHGDDCRVGAGVRMMGTSLPFPAELAHLAV